VNDERRDPPFQPFDGTRTWFESDGVAITEDLDLAVLMIRLGIASNALAANQLDGILAVESEQPRRMRGILNAMVSAAAITFESVQLGRENMKVLRPIAQGTGVAPEVLVDFGRLGAGTHPASAILDRARNKLGFHWDDDIVRASLAEYAKNQSVIWLELGNGFEPLHRLAHEVLGHAILPKNIAALFDTDPEKAREELSHHLGLIGDAMGTVTKFFSGCIGGYLGSRDSIKRRDR